MEDKDFDGVKFRYNVNQEIQILTKIENGKYSWGLLSYCFDKEIVEKRFASGDWIKLPPEPIVEPIPEKTSMQLIEERLTALEAAQVQPVVTEDWKSVVCLSYNDVMEIAKKCPYTILSTGLLSDIKMLESNIKQKLSM